MNLRTALKVSHRIRDGHRYRNTTRDRQRQRLSRTEWMADTDYWWCDLMDQFKREAPIEFAGLQFRCGMDLIEDMGRSK